MSAKQKMLAVLKGNGTFTTKQARSRFGIKNVAARIHDLRTEGYCIYSNEKTLANGDKTTVYRLGTPTRALVRSAMSAGYNFTA